jgi:hypothetical protein
MQLAPADAQRFIQGYKLLMLEVLGEQEDRITGSLVPLLAKARAKLAGEPTLLRKSIVQLEARNARPDRAVIIALEGLEVRQWVYLRDTKLHSIMIDSSADRAFGVVGLTQGTEILSAAPGSLWRQGWFATEGGMCVMASFRKRRGLDQDTEGVGMRDSRCSRHQANFM